MAGGSEPADSQPAGGGPTTCRIGVNIEELYDLDLARDTFGAVLWLWSLCPAAEFALLETIALPTGSSLEMGDIRSSPAGEADHYQYRRIQGTFRHDWDMSRYPFDRQLLVIPIDETDFGSTVLRFEADVESSFLSDEVRRGLDEWLISDLEIETSLVEVPSTYGMSDALPESYARLEATVMLERAAILPFIKLTTGVFAAALIALLSLFIDPRDGGSFSSRLAVLAGVLFGVLLSMRAADASMGDASRLTLVTGVHVVALALIVVIASLSLIERWRLLRGQRVPYPDWPLVAGAAASYVAVNVVLVAYAAWH